MSTTPMTFAERMRLRKLAEQEGKPLEPIASAPEQPKLEDPKPEGPKKFGFKAPTTSSTPEAPANAPAQPKRFGAPKPSPTVPPVTNEPDDPLQQKLGDSPDAVTSSGPAQSSYTLSSVITMANAAKGITTDQQISEGELLISGDVPEDAIRIKQRIAMLADIDTGTLKSEMDQLKALIKAAPQACQYILPEELGECVRALRRMTDNKVAIDLGRAKPRGTSKASQKAAVPVLSAAELSKIEW